MKIIAILITIIIVILVCLIFTLVSYFRLKDRKKKSLKSTVFVINRYSGVYPFTHSGDTRSLDCQ